MHRAVTKMAKEWWPLCLEGRYSINEWEFVFSDLFPILWFLKLIKLTVFFITLSCVLSYQFKPLINDSGSCQKFNILCTCCYDLIFPSAQEHGVGMDGKHSVLICLNPTQTSTSVGLCMSVTIDFNSISDASIQRSSAASWLCQSSSGRHTDK